MQGSGNNQDQNNLNKKYKFYWNSHEDPWSNERWTPFHSSAQVILEDEFQKFLQGNSNQSVSIGNYLIDFDFWMQINKFDNTKVRQVIRAEPETISNPYNLIRPIIIMRSINENFIY